jgi:hypothetical protein
MRMLGWLLILYAVIGAGLVLASIIVGGPMVGRVDRLATSATQSMGEAARAADAAADAFTGFDASLAQARESTDQAARLSRDASATLQALSQAMSLSVLGSQPLLPLADDFGTSAEQMRAMGDNLDGIGSALSTNRGQIAAVGHELRLLADRLAELRGGVAAEQAGRGLPLSWLFYGFLAWQLLPIGAAAVVGPMLLRRP